ncbi:chrysanthemyl diphosphate synthase [Tanacetum coccineum]
MKKTRLLEDKNVKVPVYVKDDSLQVFLLVHDDILDASHTQRGRPCWFRVGVVAINDDVLLRNHVHRILKKHFQGKFYYMHLLDLFNETEFQIISRQIIDTISRLAGQKDLSKYSMSLKRQIVQYKTSYYTCYLPIACALLMFGENLEDHVQVKDVLVELGMYYQIQNDYLNTFGDPNVFGKTRKDIEECKCSWLIAKALELANEEQNIILSFIGKLWNKDPEKVANVMELYHALDLKTCTLTKNELSKFLTDYGIPSEYKVMLPKSNQTIYDALDGFVSLYILSLSNNPFGYAKLATFAVMCKAYGGTIVPGECLKLLSKDNRWDKRSFKEKIPPLIYENLLYQRLGRYPVNVQTFPDPILFLAGLKPS